MSKSLFRRPGTKHFQLVHRSQRDPLIHDPEASDRVFAPLDRSQRSTNHSTGKTPSSTENHDDEANWEDAASYGVFFDDNGEYDYLQHLRTVGTGTDSYLVEAPAPKKNKAKGKGKEAVQFTENDDDDDDDNNGDDDKRKGKEEAKLPIDVLPSHPLDEVSYDEAVLSKATVSKVRGLEPDLDPRVREVLEALDDESYAQGEEASDEEQDFWNQVIKGGQLREGEEQPAWEEEDDKGTEKKKGEWDDIFAAARERAAAAHSEGEEDEQVSTDVGSEGRDTIAELVASSARRPPRRSRTGSSGTDKGSSFSMSSSSMFRNEGLRGLDDRFAEIEKMYESDSDDSWGVKSDDGQEEGGEEDGQPPVALRSDVDSIMDEFLARFELLGSKLRTVLEPISATSTSTGQVKDVRGVGTLDRIRRELAKLDLEGGGGEEDDNDGGKELRRKEKEKILEMVRRMELDEARKNRKGDMWVPVPEDIDEEKKGRWDVETVLSTYSNLSNHPKILRVRDETGGVRGGRKRQPARIKIDEKTGFPVVDGILSDRHRQQHGGKRRLDVVDDVDMDEDQEEEDEQVQETITRPKNETAESKKARKALVKSQRASRRLEKKATKEAFGNETKRQKRLAGKAVANGAAADVRVGEGVRRLA